MNSDARQINRRSFLATVSAAGAAVAVTSPVVSLAQAAAGGGKVALGIDNFSVRGLGWKAPALLDYTASLKCDALLISDLESYDSLEEKALREVRAKALDLGIKMYAGTWSICPTSKAFKDKWGTAEEHLRLGIRVAQALGSPVIRCVLGTGQDRKTDGGIEARIEDTVKVCKACRSQAMDAGVKIAIENHAGDMQAWEVVTLVKAAGEDYVGVTLDSGNATWALEDPMNNLELLGPYAVCSGMRDSMIWEDAEGAKVQWTAIGEGLVDWKAYLDRYRQLCPNVPFILEIISGFAYNVPFKKDDFWSAWPKAKAVDFARFLAMARRGKQLSPHRSADRTAEQEYQKAETERSVTYCRETLGLGLK